jgi:hypothetical protein
MAADARAAKGATLSSEEVLIFRFSILSATNFV